MHNGAALYASNAGKLDGLAPEAYIQPQESMLDNGYFKINQNNKTEYLTFGISVDRWTVNRAIVKVYADCISLRWNGTDRDNGNIFERIERDALLPNTIYTFSVLVKDVGLLSVTFTTKTEAPSEPIFIAQKRFGDLELSVHDTPESYQFNVYTYSTKESYLKAAKAELGSYFTGWPVWNYALELAKCQRYQFNLSGNFIIVSATGANFASIFVSMPVTMRQTPVVKDFSIQAIALDGQSYNAEDFTYSHIFNDKNHTHFLINLAPKVTLPHGKVGVIRLSTMLNANL